MAYKIIASQCTSCSACEAECPNVAISEKNGTFVINPKKCTECIGHFDMPQCAQYVRWITPASSTIPISRDIKPRCEGLDLIELDICRGKIHSPDAALRWRTWRGLSAGCQRLAAALASRRISAWRRCRLVASPSPNTTAIKLYMTAESRILLHGVTIDFVDSAIADRSRLSSAARNEHVFEELMRNPSEGRGRE